jgi:hypothetical protein
VRGSPTPYKTHMFDSSSMGQTASESEIYSDRYVHTKLCDLVVDVAPCPNLKS